MILLRIFNYITTWFSEKKPYSRYATCFFSTTNGRPTLSSTKHFWRLRCILEMHPHSMPEQPRLQRLQDFEAKHRQWLLIWWFKREAKLWQKHIEAPPHQIKRSPSGNFQAFLVSWKVEILSIYPYMHPSIFIVFFSARFACRSWTLIISKSTKTLGNGMPRSSEGLMDMTGLEAARFLWHNLGGFKSPVNYRNMETWYQWYRSSDAEFELLVISRSFIWQVSLFFDQSHFWNLQKGTTWCVFPFSYTWEWIWLKKNELSRILEDQLFTFH